MTAWSAFKTWSFTIDDLRNTAQDNANSSKNFFLSSSKWALEKWTQRFDLFLFKIFYAKCWRDSASSKRWGRGTAKCRAPLSLSGSVWGTIGPGWLEQSKQRWQGEETRPDRQEVKSQKGQRPLQGLGLINSARHTKSLENFFFPFQLVECLFSSLRKAYLQTCGSRGPTQATARTVLIAQSCKTPTESPSFEGGVKPGVGTQVAHDNHIWNHG